MTPAGPTERTSYRIRLARPDDIAPLPAIETAAAQLFRQSAYPWIADEPNGMSETLMVECQDEWRLWVATGADDRPIGFAAYTCLDDQVWLGELSVHPDHARRRIGAALIAAAERFYGRRGARRMTLTTFSDIPWNAPYYGRLGFSVIPSLEAESFLACQIEKELEWGVPTGSRVAMQKRLNDGGQYE